MGGKKTDFFLFVWKQIIEYIFKTNMKGETYHTKQLTQKLGRLENSSLFFSNQLFPTSSTLQLAHYPPLD